MSCVSCAPKQDKPLVAIVDVHFLVQTGNRPGQTGTGEQTSKQMKHVQSEGYPEFTQPQSYLDQNILRQWYERLVKE